MLVFAIILRILHIAAVIAAGGAALFQLLAVHPVFMGQLEAERRRSLREAIAQRWRPVVWTCVALLLLTGVLNYVYFKVPQYHDHPRRGLYHGLMGVKILAALVVFHAATVLALPGPRGEKYRGRAPLWLGVLVSMIGLIVVIGAILRNFDSLPPG